MLHPTSRAKSCLATPGRNDSRQDIHYFLHSIAKAIADRPHRIAESSGTARYSLNSSRETNNPQIPKIASGIRFLTSSLPLNRIWSLVPSVLRTNPSPHKPGRLHLDSYRLTYLLYLLVCVQGWSPVASGPVSEFRSPPVRLSALFSKSSTVKYLSF